MIDLSRLRTLVEAHGAVARVVIAAHRGSTPRETGTAMCVWARGFDGTIGGGRLEWEAMAAARALLADGAETRVARMPLGPSLGQCCGGTVTLVTERWDAARIEGLAGSRYTRCVAEPAAPAADAPSQGPGLRFENGWLSEPLGVDRRPILIHGAGHVGQALATLLAPIPDFQVSVIDPRPEFLADIPKAVVPRLSEAGHFPADATHFVMTHRHDLDLEICHRLLAQDFAFAGLIGSETKWARFRSRLSQLGHADDQIQRITCPIGDPKLGKEPQAIAIGVAARLLSADDGRGTG